MSVAPAYAEPQTRRRRAPVVARDPSLIKSTQRRSPILESLRLNGNLPSRIECQVFTKILLAEVCPAISLIFQTWTAAARISGAVMNQGYEPICAAFLPARIRAYPDDRAEASQAEIKSGCLTMRVSSSLPAVVRYPFATLQGAVSEICKPTSASSNDTYGINGDAPALPRCTGYHYAYSQTPPNFHSKPDCWRKRACR